MSKTLITIATYDEIENLPGLVDEVFRIVPEAHILVVDDNSPDGTGRWCDQRAAEEPRLRVLHRAGKLGLGSATIEGMQYAIEQGYQYVLVMDADFSHHPRYLPDIIGGMTSPDRPAVDVMIGSRYVPGGRVEGWPWVRHFMSGGVNWFARGALGLKCRDCSGSYRCYRTETLARLDFDHIRSRGYSYLEEILWHLKRLGARFGETPIVFVDRTAGRSKINAREAIAALWVIFCLGVRNLLKR